MSKQSVQLPSISLRDYFAGQALSGLVARGCTVDHATRTAYEIADAMLKARG